MLSARKKGVMLSYVLMFLEVLSTLFLTPFIIRSLGQAEYGVYKLIVAVNSYLLLLDLGVGNAVVRYISKYRAEEDKLKERQFFGVANLYYGCIAAITLVCGGVLIAVFPTAFSTGLTQEEIALGQKLLGVTMLNSAVVLGTTAYTNTIAAYERFDISNGFSIIQILLRVLLTWIALQLNMGSMALVCITLLVSVLCKGFFVYYVRVKIKLKAYFHQIPRSFVKEIVGYSSLVLLQMIATQLNSSVDQILFGVLVVSSSSIIGIYSIGAQLLQYFISIGSAMKGVMMPGIVGLVSRKATNQQLMDEMVKIGRITYLITGIILVGFLIFGQNFVALWAGAENGEAYLVAAILMAVWMIILILSVGQYVLWAMNEHKEMAIMKFLIVVANIALTVVLIQWKPLLGATIGTAISLVLGDILVMHRILKKKIELATFPYYRAISKGITLSLALAGVVGLAVSLLPLSGWVGLLIGCIAMVGAYAAALLLFGMNAYEKDLLWSLLQKFRLRRSR